MVAAVGGFAVHAVGYGGRVEIAPHALTLVRPSKPKAPAKAPAKKPMATVSELVATTPWLAKAHDPPPLLSRAREMEKLGLDVTVIEVPLASTFTHVGLAALWPTESLPVYGRDHHVDAFELRKLPPDSVLRVAGMAEGDELLGVDGYDFVDDSFRNIDTLAIQKRGWVIVELARAQHHVVLSIRWDTK